MVAATAPEDLGHRVLPIDMDLPGEVAAAFLNMVSSGLADYDGTVWDRAEPHVQAAHAAAQGVPSLTYVRGAHHLQRFTRRFVMPWEEDFDVLLTATTSIEPPRSGEVLSAVHASGGATALPVLQMAVMTSPFNVTGRPAISLPLYQAPSGLPVGAQLVGEPLAEATLI